MKTRFNVRILSLVVVVSAISSLSVLAATQGPIPFAGRSQIPSSFSGDVDKYQIGDIWGKLSLTRSDVRNGSTALRNAARATARYSGMFGGATGFYMGKFAGQHIMGTNHHVVDGVGCKGVRVT